REIALADRIAGIGRMRQPAAGECGIALDPEAFGKAGAHVVLCPRNARLGERPPDGERRRVIAAHGRLAGLGAAVGTRTPWVLGAWRHEPIKPAHYPRLGGITSGRARRDYVQTPPRPRDSADQAPGLGPRPGRSPEPAARAAPQ